MANLYQEISHITSSGVRRNLCSGVRRKKEVGEIRKNQEGGSKNRGRKKPSQNWRRLVSGGAKY